MIQQLRLHAPNARGSGSISDQGTRAHMPQLKIPHTSTKTEEPRSHRLQLRSQTAKLKIFVNVCNQKSFACSYIYETIILIKIVSSTITFLKSPHSVLMLQYFQVLNYVCECNIIAFQTFFWQLAQPLALQHFSSEPLLMATQSGHLYSKLSQSSSPLITCTSPPSPLTTILRQIPPPQGEWLGSVICELTGLQRLLGRGVDVKEVQSLDKPDSKRWNAYGGSGFISRYTI